VVSLLGRIPERYITALATLRNGSVFCPLFSAFGPEPVRTWMAIGEAKVLLTTAALYRRKIADWRGELSLQHVVLINDDGAPTATNTIDFAAAMARASAEPRLAATGPEDLALLHFTSGTHSDDVFRCTADPGWVTGTSYGITTDRHFWSLPGGRGRATTKAFGSTLILAEARS
jgi:acetyl-CoA synthetase